MQYDGWKGMGNAMMKAYRRCDGIDCIGNKDGTAFFTCEFNKSLIFSHRTM